MEKELKFCSKCKTLKERENFGLSRKSKSGLSFWCKECKSQSRRALYLKTREKELAQNKIWKEQNKARHDFLKRVWKQKNKDYYSNQQREYRLGRKDLMVEYSKKWYEDNKDRKLSLGREWYLKNKEYKDAQNRDWRKENPDKSRRLARIYRMVNIDRCNLYSANYRARKLQATPLWLGDAHISEIEDFYTAAQMFKIYTGNEYHVDHIVPLQGKNVCGLHVPWNLQLLPWDENLSKSNKF